MEKPNFRIGIVGGMGPMAGVHLQKLIIENTPASKDQDHIKVICFTNPKIPDRTKSLQDDNGDTYLAEVLASVKVLEAIVADCILMPCNTAHSRFADIQNAAKVPVLNMVEITLEKIRKSGAKSFGLLATDGSIATRVFETDKNLNVILPDPKMQKEVMEIIYAIKSGSSDDEYIASRLDEFAKKLSEMGAETIILGCTELSLYFSMLKSNNIIDPLVELAKEAVSMATFLQ